MREEFSRTALLIGEEGLNKLSQAMVAVFGIGGVGGFAVEALVRAGIGKLILVDPDYVEKSNLNRQLHATVTTVGRPKVAVMKERILSINPTALVEAKRERYTSENAESLLCSDYSYIIDAIDDVQAKVDLIVRAKELNIPIISSMGTGNRLSAAKFRVADISETSGCPLARMVRRKLRELGVTNGVKVVFSPEAPMKPTYNKNNKQQLGTISFVPPVAGFLMAGECVRDLLFSY